MLFKMTLRHSSCIKKTQFRDIRLAEYCKVLDLNANLALNQAK